MPYGFKCYDASGNVICDGTSQMLMLHALGSQSIADGGTWTFSYTALNHEPVFILQSDPAIYKYTADHVKTGADWTGVVITNLWSATTFFVWVYRRKI